LEEGKKDNALDGNELGDDALLLELTLRSLVKA